MKDNCKYPKGTKPLFIVPVIENLFLRGQKQFAGSVPIPTVVDNFIQLQPDQNSHPSEDRARPYAPSRGSKIVNYLETSMDETKIPPILPSLTVEFREESTRLVTNSDGSKSLHFYEKPEILDGNGRYGAFAMMNGKLKGVGIFCTFLPYVDNNTSRQRFADLSMNTPIGKSERTRFDTRVRYRVFVSDLWSHNEDLQRMVRRSESLAWGQSSCFSYGVFCDALKPLVEFGLNEKQPLTSDMIASMIETVIENIEPLTDMRDNPRNHKDASKFRKQYVIFKANTFTRGSGKAHDFSRGMRATQQKMLLKG